MNQQNDLIKAKITIASVESGTTKTGKQRIKIKSTDNLTFSLWALKSDGSKSKAMEGIEKLGYNAQGQTIDIMYKEENAVFEGKNIVYRTIVMLNPVQTMQPTQQTMQQTNDFANKLTESTQNITQSTHLQEMHANKIADLERRIATLEHNLTYWMKLDQKTTETAFPNATGAIDSNDEPPLEAYFNDF